MAADTSDGESLAANICMTAIGIGYLFPISAIWAAFDYWKLLFPTRNIEFTVTLVYQVGSLATVAALSIARSVKLGPRIIGGFLGQFACLFAILAFRWIVLLLPNGTLYALVLVLVLGCSVATGYLDSALLSLCSQYSPRMQGFLQLGIGFGTLVSVIYRDGTKLLLNGDMVDSVTAYFTVALTTVLICIGCYRQLMSLPISRAIAVLDGKVGLLTPSGSSPGSPSGNASPALPVCLTPVLSPYIGPPRKVSDLEGRQSPMRQCTPEYAEVPTAEAATGDSSAFGAVLKIIWKNQLAVFLNLFLTTLCYPGILTSIPCRDFLSLQTDAWFQTLLLTVFTLADTAARFVTHKRLCLSHQNILLTVAVRAALFPVVLACAMAADWSDWLSFLCVAMFGALNGYCVSLSLIVVNEIPDLTFEQRKTCGRISACAVNGGLAAGSLAAAVLASAFGLAGSHPD